MGTIAIQVGTDMTEMNMTMQNLSIVITKLVIMQIVGVKQIDTLILHLLTGSSTLSWRSCKNYCQQQNGQKEYQ